MLCAAVFVRVRVHAAGKGKMNKSGLISLHRDASITATQPMLKQLVVV